MFLLMVGSSISVSALEASVDGDAVYDHDQEAMSQLIEEIGRPLELLGS